MSHRKKKITYSLGKHVPDTIEILPLTISQMKSMVLFSVFFEGENKSGDFSLSKKKSS